MNRVKNTGDMGLSIIHFTFFKSKIVFGNNTGSLTMVVFKNGTGSTTRGDT